MPTLVVSGRVDADTKRVADAYIKQAGLTTGEVISFLWCEIASTGVVPRPKEGEKQTPKEAAAARLMELRSKAAKGTPLATMTDEEIRREIHERD